MTVSPCWNAAAMLFVQGIQLYNLSFDMMAKMFNGERTPKQLKRRYEKELREHPEMIHRALRLQITNGACVGNVAVVSYCSGCCRVIHSCTYI